MVKEISTKSMWIELERLYEGETIENKAFLTCHLVNLKYKDRSPIFTHLKEMKCTVNQLCSIKLILDDEMRALLALSSLLESWKAFLVSLTNHTTNG